MKFKNNSKKGLEISLCISIIIIILLIVVNVIPNGIDTVKYGFTIEKAETPIWKIICYVIIVVLFILDFFIQTIMCRCPHCKKYLRMNIHKQYCPYCSKKLEE